MNERRRPHGASPDNAITCADDSSRPGRIARLVPRRQPDPLETIATALDQARRDLATDAYLELLRRVDDLTRAERDRAHALTRPRRRHAVL